MYCPACGAEIEDNAVFCSNCGEKIREKTDSGTKITPAPSVKKKEPTKKFPVKEAAIIAGALALIIAVTVIIGSVVSSARPENIAADYLKNYYNGKVQKADDNCLVTMRDQWDISIDKYHNGDRKAYFVFLSSSYERTISTFAGAYKALDEMTKERFDQYYGSGYSVHIGKCEKLDLSDDDVTLLLNAVLDSDFADTKLDIAELSGEVMKIRVNYVIDGDVKGTDSHNDITLIKYNGKWRVLNPLIFGW